MIEAMKQALEALGEKFTSGNSIEVERATITRDEYLALRQAIEQAEKQEPVAWVLKMGNEKILDSHFNDIQELDDGTPLYTAPPKREWVGLTTEEAAICWTNSEVQSWKNIEAKLKEKNYD
jgi:hypothetical protein